MILGAFVALAVGGCGKGLYTHAGQFHESDSSVGGVIDPGTGTGVTAGTGGTGVSTSPDAYAPTDGSAIRNPDAAPKYDAEPGPCGTHYVSNGTPAGFERDTPVRASAAVKSAASLAPSTEPERASGVQVLAGRGL